MPITTGAGPKTSDCLAVLRAAVGLDPCLPCICDTSGDGKLSAADALLCLRVAVGQNLALQCPECTATGSCPGIAEWRTLAGTDLSCTADEDCFAGTCDETIGRCRTSTVLDLGWTGLAHGGDFGDSETIRAKLDCAASDAPCGQCEIVGIDPSSGNCRCSNDSRKICDEPFGLDVDDCPACEAGAYVGLACAGNADCSAGVCSRRCSNNLAVTCSNNGQCPGGSCDASTECDNGKGCFVDADCIGTCTTSSQCNCYDGPPVPLAPPGPPLCLVKRLNGELSGTVDADSGAAAVDENVRLLVHLGDKATSPCPVCGGRCSNSAQTTCVVDDDCPGGGHCNGDPMSRDGQRDGTCIGGANDGQPCDVGAYSWSFPVGDGDRGGGLSLDCMPAANRFVGGSGQILGLTFTTSESSLGAGLSCLGENATSNCPCLVCSTDPTVPCHSDGDCSTQPGACSQSPLTTCSTNGDCDGVNVGPCNDTIHRCQKATGIVCANDNDCAGVNAGSCEPSTCSAFGAGVPPAPNQCDDGACTDVGGGHGRCTTGPDDLYCEGVVTAAGDGIVPCSTNADCTGGDIPIEGGTACTLGQRRRCFLDPIVAAGSEDQTSPALATTFCMPPTSNTAVNTIAGLPGPGRWIRQSVVGYRCATAPGLVYVPGEGGCP